MLKESSCFGCLAETFKWNQIGPKYVVLLGSDDSGKIVLDVFCPGDLYRLWMWHGAAKNFLFEITLPNDIPIAHSWRHPKSQSLCTGVGSAEAGRLPSIH
jgi:hypothetical protein